MKNIYLIIFVFLNLLSCNRFYNTSNNSLLEEDTRAYNENKKESDISSVLLDHFPQSIERAGYGYGYVTNVNKEPISYMLTYYNVDIGYLDSVELPYIKQNIQSYCVNDSALIVVDFENNHKRICSDYDQDIFIPYFKAKENPYYDEFNLTVADLYSANSRSGLVNDFIVYILDSKQGKYWEERLIPLENMPKGWGNGYSKGICLNRKKGVIIYWTIIW